jgi:hypothetical protein
MERSTTLAIVALVEIALGLGLYLRTGRKSRDCWLA